MLDIVEIFYSLQGESTHAGLPCTFVRTAGCNLRCSYCDTRYSYEEEARRYEIDEVFAVINTYACPLVEITGGEPLLQEDTYLLVNRLLHDSYKVLLETNGSLPVDRVPPEVHIIMDIKCPGSSMHQLFNNDNLMILSERKRQFGSRDEIKFVIESVEDYRWTREMIRSNGLQHIGSIVISPVTDRISPVTVAELILADTLPARLQVQLHAILWPQKKRGR